MRKGHPVSQCEREFYVEPNDNLYFTIDSHEYVTICRLKLNMNMNMRMRMFRQYISYREHQADEKRQRVFIRKEL